MSGWLRRRAYRLPDHRARRWLLLMVADRLDALEHRRGRSVAAAIAFLIGLAWLFSSSAPIT